ncbi:hypothetical protein [Phycicoccus avicenniae]|uniref:hypothetical protein n=1 Tax=Phycicoccus avicenniae TaxID=2828860 RepID=UPI003D2A4DD5
MREMSVWQRRGLLGAALALVALVVFARGLVAVATLGTAVLLVCLVGAALPLQRDDGVDWTWHPPSADEVPPVPGIAALHDLLTADKRDAAAAERLHRLLGRLAEDSRTATHDGPLARYLSGPPRALTPAEADAVLADLESPVPTKESA